MIIFFYGEDSFRSSKKIKELKDKFLREVDKSGNSLSVFDGKEIDLKKINERFGASSLLSPKSMIVIENVFLNKGKDFLGELLEYLKGKEKSENIIIFREDNIKTKKSFSKTGDVKNIIKIDAGGQEKPLLKKEKELFDFLAKGKFVQEFKNFTNSELIAWIKKEVEARDGQISLRAIQVLISLVGNDLWQTDKEISKLINYKKGKIARLTEGGEPAHIDIAEVEDLVKGSFDENIFALTDAIGAKNKALAAKLLEEQYGAGLTDSYLISMITRQIKIILQIRSALDHGCSSRKIATDLKLHPFVIQKGINQAHNFNSEVLKSILNRLTEIDYKMKIGATGARILLNLLIGKI